MRGHQRKAGKKLNQSTWGRVNRLQTTKEEPFLLFLKLCLCCIIQQCLFCCLQPGVQASVQSMFPVGPNNSLVYISCGPKIRFNMTGRCLRPWSVKAGKTSGLQRPEALRDLEGWQSLKPTEGRSFKWNGFHWWNVRLFSLREMSPRCSVALSPSLFKSFTCCMKEWSPSLVAIEKEIMILICME